MSWIKENLWCGSSLTYQCRNVPVVHSQLPTDCIAAATKELKENLELHHACSKQHILFFKNGLWIDLMLSIRMENQQCIQHKYMWIPSFTCETNEKYSHTDSQWLTRCPYFPLFHCRASLNTAQDIHGQWHLTAGVEKSANRSLSRFWSLSSEKKCLSSILNHSLLD